MSQPNYEIAVVIPCFNEEATIGKVVRDFGVALPNAKIYVFDNNSQDRTGLVAKEAGAIVVREKKKGKGHVVQSMFQKITADFYVMVDGDDTYPAESVKKLLEVVVKDRADMAVGNRLTIYDSNAFRRFHFFGNNVVRFMVNRLFDASLKDIMSGFRVVSRDVVNGISIQSRGFEVETEMTLKCLNYGFLVEEVDIPYRKRPEGSFSKLSTLRDGFRVLKAILIIMRDYQPFFFFSSVAAVVFLIGIAGGTVVVLEYIESRFITRVPLAILSVGCVLSSLMLLAIGLILDSINNRFHEIYTYVRGRINIKDN